MAVELLDGTGRHGFSAEHGLNYGCAGRGMYDAFEPTKGALLDDTDKAFQSWKKCIQCAVGFNKNGILPYDYDKQADSCGKISALRIDQYLVTAILRNISLARYFYHLLMINYRKLIGG